MLKTILKILVFQMNLTQSAQIPKIKNHQLYFKKKSINFINGVARQTLMNKKLVKI